MNRIATATETLSEAWCSDPGLHLEATPAGLKLSGEATAEETVVGVRVAGVSVELALRPGMRAETAARLLVGALPPALGITAVGVGAEGAQLLSVGAEVSAVPPPEVARTLVDATVS